MRPGQFHQLILALLCAVKRLHRRSCAAEHDGDVQGAAKSKRNLACMIGGPILVLIRWLVLFVEDDEAEVGQRREDGRARPDHHVNLARPDAPPLVVAFAGTQRAVDDGDAARKAAREALHGLRGERDFRHQHDATLAPRNHSGQCLQIDLRLAASRYAMQQNGRALRRVSQDGIHRSLLIGRERQRFAAGDSEAEQGVALHLGLLDDENAFLHEVLQLFGREGAGLAQRARRPL